MELEVGKTYKTKSGRLVEIVKHDPEWGNGMFWGNSVDSTTPKLDNERWTPDNRWWSYISQFSMFGHQELRNPELDIVEKIKIIP
jgi:hypothetical protein